MGGFASQPRRGCEEAIPRESHRHQPMSRPSPSAANVNRRSDLVAIPLQRRIRSSASSSGSSAPDWRLLETSSQDRCLARLGPGVRRKALHAAARPLSEVWLSSGLQSVRHREEAWLERGLPSSLPGSGSLTPATTARPMPATRPRSRSSRSVPRRTASCGEGAPLAR